MHASTRRRASVIAALLFATVLAGCGHSAGSPATSSTTTTSTTSTTLPASVGVLGTRGQDFLGVAFRIPVVRPRLGTMQLPPSPTALGAALASTQIAYRHFGSGPNLLLIMGEHGTMTWWDPQLLSALAGQFTVTIFDLPGVGYSESSPKLPTLDTYADLTAGLAAALGLETNGVEVLGWGLGGDIALDAELRHPGFATSLALVDSPAPGTLDVVSASAQKAFSAVVATTVGLSRLMFPDVQSDVRSGWLQRIGQVSPDDMTASAVKDEAAVVASLPRNLGLMHLLGKIKVPVQVFSGSADVVVPSSNTARLARSIPKAKVVMLPNAGYASLVSGEQQFLQALSINGAG